MVYFRNIDGNRATVPFYTGLLESAGRGLVSSSPSLSDDTFYLRTLGAKSWYKAIVSIVICTYGRPESLNDTLESLSHQTFRNFEVILITEKGDLSRLREKGLEASWGDIVSFIDDDVYCKPAWLQSVVETFKKNGVVGVTGPTEILEEFKKNRDSIKFKRIKKFQDWLFEVDKRPGHLSKCGAPSFASNYNECEYEGEVQYLECCNMSVKRKEALDAGGFDNSYIKTSEWSEVELSLRLGKVGKLLFRRNSGLYHRPSKAGVYGFRLSTRHRWKNFVLFQRRWIPVSFKRHLYWVFIWTYLKMKELRMI